MAKDENQIAELRRYFLISNIAIVALITILWIGFAFISLMESYEGFIEIALIGLALTTPGWIFLILYGFGCYRTQDWRRTISAMFASIQIFVFLLIPIVYVIDYFI